MESERHDRIQSLRDYKDFLKADLEAHNISSWTPFLKWTNPELHFQRCLRLAEYLGTGKSPIFRMLFQLTRLRLAGLQTRTGISIPPYVFGRGLSIAHFGSIVVSDKARIGMYCRIHSATNIGEYFGESPVLGNFVYVGPGAVIYGGISLSDFTAVGANSVVNKSVHHSGTVAGMPAKLISNSSSLEVMPEWIQQIFTEIQKGS